MEEDVENLVKPLQCNKLYNLLIPQHVRDNKHWRGIMPEFAKLDIEAKVHRGLTPDPNGSPYFIDAKPLYCEEFAEKGGGQ